MMHMVLELIVSTWSKISIGNQHSQHLLHQMSNSMELMDGLSAPVENAILLMMLEVRLGKIWANQNGMVLEQSVNFLMAKFNHLF